MILRNITLIALTLLSLLSCNHTEKKAVQSDASLNNNLDSTTAQYANESIDESEPSEEKLFQKAYSDLIKSYNKNETIDSIFIIGTDSFRVKMEYSCLKNTKVVIPKHFLTPYMNKDFSTHDFVLKLILLKNNQSYFERTYEKKYFYKQLQNENLRKFGVIFSPYIERVDENIVLGISITIPLTDVGEGVGDTLSFSSSRK
jgi:hypothetical protein